MYLKEGNVKELTTTSGKASQGSTMREKNEYLLAQVPSFLGFRHSNPWSWSSPEKELHFICDHYSSDQYYMTVILGVCWNSKNHYNNLSKIVSNTKITKLCVGLQLVTSLHQDLW